MANQSGRLEACSEESFRDNRHSDQASLEQLAGDFEKKGMETCEQKAFEESLPAFSRQSNPKALEVSVSCNYTNSLL